MNRRGFLHSNWDFFYDQSNLNNAYIATDITGSLASSLNRFVKFGNLEDRLEGVKVDFEIVQWEERWEKV
jgi:hypothetical protein